MNETAITLRRAEAHDAVLFAAMERDQDTAPFIKANNAARHADSVVRVSVETTADRVVMAVDDDGRGIDPIDRERVFERFVRLDEARVRDEGGAGLGLAVVDTVVTAAGGTVTVSHSDLGGARFEVALPPAD